MNAHHMTKLVLASALILTAFAITPQAGAVEGCKYTADAGHAEARPNPASGALNSHASTTNPSIVTLCTKIELELWITYDIDASAAVACVEQCYASAWGWHEAFGSTTFGGHPTSQCTRDDLCTDGPDFCAGHPCALKLKADVDVPTTGCTSVPYQVKAGALYGYDGNGDGVYQDHEKDGETDTDNGSASVCKSL